MTQFDSLRELYYRKSWAKLQLSKHIEKQVMTRLLRKKYLNEKFNNEGNFLIQMYRAMDNKRGKQLGLKIENFLKD